MAAGGRSAVPVSLLTVNMKIVFAKHGSGRKESAPCVCEPPQSKMAGRSWLGVTPDHTSFNNVGVCNHVMRILGCTGR